MPDLYSSNTCFNRLLYRCWEEEVFVFNPLTGHTHILNEAGWQLLLACADTPQSEASLQTLLLAGASELDPEEAEESLRVHLDHLCQLGLLQPKGRHAIV